MKTFWKVVGILLGLAVLGVVVLGLSYEFAIRPVIASRTGNDSVLPSLAAMLPKTQPKPVAVTSENFDEMFAAKMAEQTMLTESDVNAIVTNNVDSAVVQARTAMLKEVQALIEEAVAENPGITADNVQTYVTEALKGVETVSESEVLTLIKKAIAEIPAPAPVQPAVVQQSADLQGAGPADLTSMPWGTNNAFSGVIFEIGDYPTEGTVSEQEAWASNLIGCQVKKIVDGDEAGAFVVNYKASAPHKCVVPTKFLGTVHEALGIKINEGRIVLRMGDDNALPTWAATYRYLPLYQEGPCGILAGETVNAIDENYSLWPDSVLVPPACPLPDISKANPAKAEETAMMQELFGLPLIRIGTSNAFQVTSIDGDPFTFTAQPGYFYEVHNSDPVAMFLSMDSSADFQEVHYVVIYPANYFSACDAQKLALTSGAQVPATEAFTLQAVQACPAP